MLNIEVRVMTEPVELKDTYNQEYFKIYDKQEDKDGGQYALFSKEETVLRILNVILSVLCFSKASFTGWV